MKRFKKITGLLFRVVSLPFILIGGVGAVLFIISDLLYE